MTRLSLFDQFFFRSEQAGLPPLYMGGAMIIDGSKAKYPLNARNVAEHVAARLEKIPLMRKKVVQDPMRIGQLRLVDDPAFEARNHVTTTVVPKPGGYKELTECLGVFSAQRMDPHRPLWHFEVMEGLEGGRLAIAMHLHHSVIDGLGAQDALSSIYDLKPVRPEKTMKQKWRVDAEPVPFELLSAALRENAERAFIRTPRYIIKSGAPLLRLLGNKLFAAVKPHGKRKEALNRLPKVKRTSLNPAKGSAQRVISYIEIPMPEAQRLRKHFGCSINDLALLLNSCALEHYFAAIGEDVDFDLVSVMPMNARKEGDKSMGNVLAIGRVNLHNTIASLSDRLRAIADDTARIKTQHRSTGGPDVDARSLMELFSPLLVDGLCYAMARFNLAGKILLGNLAITNVPGSPLTLYIAGAPVVTGVPMAPTLGAGVALTVTITSNDRYLMMGYHGDGAAIRDKELFVAGAAAGFAKLRRLAQPPTRKRAVTKRPAPARKKRK